MQQMLIYAIPGHVKLFACTCNTSHAHTCCDGELQTQATRVVIYFVIHINCLRTISDVRIRAQLSNITCKEWVVETCSIRQTVIKARSRIIANIGNSSSGRLPAMSIIGTWQPRAISLQLAIVTMSIKQQPTVTWIRHTYTRSVRSLKYSHEHVVM